MVPNEEIYFYFTNDDGEICHSDYYELVKIEDNTNKTVNNDGIQSNDLEEIIVKSI
jgi:hypothetical protein